MPVLHAIVLGIVQGLSEFLPISSSGHLILVPELFEWNELVNRPQLNKTFDVALHIGTLVAALWYFRKDLGRYAAAGLRTIRTRQIRTTDERLAWLLLLSAVPGAIVGAALSSTIDKELGDPVLIGVMLVVFGVVLWFADRLAGSRPTESFGTRDAIVMGVAQALALQPGISRSGVTMSVGRWLHFDRAAAARLSFLMSIPIIGGAALYKAVDVLTGRGIPDDFVEPMIWGTIASGVSGFVAIAGLLRLITTKSFAPFVVYRIVFGIGVIVIFATGLR
ncbi:MAG: undecaprenyl-diphosphate phosphatase [Actinobacteria bacterium]|nr:undecaprenyl-diphosphate phosphatase [Actinomycetota bacterium]